MVKSQIGKRILVTGAYGGLGLSLCKLLSENGAHVTALGRDRKRLEELRDCLRGPQKHSVIALDINNYQDYSAAFAIEKKFHGVVHAAGLFIRAALRNMTLDEMRIQMDTNLLAPLFLTKSLLDSQKLEMGSSVVFLSSLSTSHPSPGLSVYAASKGGLLPAAKSFAQEYASKKIRFNVVTPGAVKTDRTISVFAAQPELLAPYEKRYALGLGRPDSISELCSFLLSDASDWITGSEFVADGGFQ